ncbi:hypothetical protein CRENBAI_005863 [Crenichthys baileyi]|uniref:Uncharacterized protein n=1 Tax=Crenichthys baileyi TaxID=28760 RepID=A0AAV9S187_9TELE
MSNAPHFQTWRTFKQQERFTSMWTHHLQGQLTKPSADVQVAANPVFLLRRFISEDSPASVSSLRSLQEQT